MLNKSDMRPAYATVGQNSSASDHSKIDYAAFSAAQNEENDFGAFGDTSAKNATASKAPQQRKPQQQNRAPKKAPKNGPSISAKTILIAVAAVVALVLIIALFAAVFSSPGKNILRKDDVYASYVDSNDVHHVLFNGKEVKHSFTGKVTLLPAKDCSFAYIFEEVVSDDGTNVINMFILNGKKITALEDDASSIIACAEYEPGVIFKKGNEVLFYSNREFESLSQNPGAANFIISGDATTIVFTEPTRSSTTEEGTATQVKYFRDAGFNNIGESAGLVPVALSIDGKYVYATDSTGSFYYLKVTKRGEEYTQKTIMAAAAYMFHSVTELNATGTEVVFTVNTNTESLVSAIYKIGDKKIYPIAAGAFRYTPIDKEVVCPATFVDAAFTVDRTLTTEDDSTVDVTSTYYYTGGEGAAKLADTKGTFSPDGKYFYYLDYGKLYRVALSSKNFENDRQEITTADAFLLTEKGDIYTYTKPSDNTPGSINWRSADKTSSKRISNKADLNCMYLCGNSIYFSETIDGNVKLYVSTNGSVKEEVTFKKTVPASCLTIVMGTGDKGYASFLDVDGNTQLLYTANAKTFDVIGTCTSCTINGVSSGNTASGTTNNSGSNQQKDETDSDENVG
jgi:hypothetical protein